MRVTVDLRLCQGYANCVDSAPDVFDLGENGLVVLLQEEPPADHEHAVREAVRLCPVQAISYIAGDA
jgi:ferredoxin